MADNPPLDEIVFSSPQIAQQMGGIQTNTGEAREAVLEGVHLTVRSSTIFFRISILRQDFQ